MTFTVLWKRSAEADLAAIWLNAKDRASVTLAADSLEQQLRSNPNASGEPLFDTVRELIVPPLGIHFEVIGVDRIVQVLAIWAVSES
jgi:plasmid stabilization system protein ParE